MATAADSKKGRRRSNVYAGRRRVAAEVFDRSRFRYTLRREQRRLPPLNIDAHVESCSWGRSNAVSEGQLSFRRPLTPVQASAILQGDRVLCEVDLRGDARWRRLWQMTVDTPSEQISGGSVSLNLKPELKALQASKAAFSFRDKTARQITLEVARRFHVQVGSLPTARHRIDKIVRKSASPTDFLDDVWEKERTATGRRFDVSISRGLIDVVEIREPSSVLTLERAVVDATLERSLAEMTSAVIVTSTRKVGGARKKLRVKVVDRGRLRRYGYVVRQVNKAGLNSAAAARRYGREQLARLQKPNGEITFTHPGVPFLDRGAVVQLVIKEVAFNQIAFVTGTQHSASAGSYMMDVTVNFSDPWEDAREDRAKRKREAAARRRKRSGSSTATAPKAKKSARRS